MPKKIHTLIENAFDHYHDMHDNIVDGKSDWDFVLADIMMHLGVDRIIEEMGSLDEFYFYFNSLVEFHLSQEAV